LCSFGTHRLQSDGRSKRKPDASSGTVAGDGDGEALALGGGELGAELSGEAVGVDEGDEGPGAAVHAIVIEPSTANATVSRGIQTLVLSPRSLSWTR
jgi:hypothetical protein